MKLNKIILMTAMLVSAHAFSMQYLKDNAIKIFNYTCTKASECGHVVTEKVSDLGHQAYDYSKEKAPVVATKAKEGFNWASNKTVAGAQYVAQNGPTAVKNAWANKYVKIGAAVVAAAAFVAITSKVIVNAISNSARARQAK